jgi:hypothetical protein
VGGAHARPDATACAEAAHDRVTPAAPWAACLLSAPPPPLRTNRTRRVPHPVLIGHAIPFLSVSSPREASRLMQCPTRRWVKELTQTTLKKFKRDMVVQRRQAAEAEHRYYEKALPKFYGAWQVARSPGGGATPLFARQMQPRAC